MDFEWISVAEIIGVQIRIGSLLLRLAHVLRGTARDLFRLALRFLFNFSRNSIDWLLSENYRECHIYDPRR